MRFWPNDTDLARLSQKRSYRRRRQTDHIRMGRRSRRTLGSTVSMELVLHLFCEYTKFLLLSDRVMHFRNSRVGDRW